ncbi:putative LPS assembly protein LptD [Spirosoma linguale]|uniref:Organic solvent tolerance protein OstA-like protein n=1 Tax=Spirosoma linguale (strain ATCC 33905 / DSM 74 / LMG 10896 / Claus 1) TaxID=504472 RepID=D2QRH6_SPILD|nr:Organic solvent tolerance protein OstA-like protein [Spirosoma linguale DSM 74]
MNTFVCHRLNGFLANIIFLIILKKAYFILWPSLIRPTWIKASCFLICLLWTLTALGQSKETPRQPSKGGLPPAGTPAQRVPDATSETASDSTPAPRKPGGRVVTGPSSGTATLLNSSTGAAGTSQESDLERQLNNSYSAPNRLGTDTRQLSKPLPSPAARPASRDSVRSRPTKRVATAPAPPRLTRVRLDSLRYLQPKPVRLVQTRSGLLPVTGIAARKGIVIAKPTAPQPPVRLSARKRARAAKLRQQEALAQQKAAAKQEPVQPGLVSPNIVRPESQTVLGAVAAQADSMQLAVRDSIAKDSLQSADSFKTTVKYQAKDSTFYSADGRTVELFGDASVVYGDISLKADYIRLNYLTNEVYAIGRYDSTAKKLIGRPIFQDGEGKYDAKEIRYNFKSRKGRIQGVITQQGEGNIRGQTVKKDNEDNLYIGKAIYTTCNLATPHFHINASKLKVIHNTQVVAGPFNLVINQIPLPIGLPFGFFPFPKRKEIGVSGIIVPQYGEEPNGRGFYLRDGGYYWAVNEHLGLQFKGQIYSRGSWGLGLSSAYNKRYSYSGSLNLQFNRNRSGDRVDKTQTPRNDFSFTWAHSPVPRGRGSFSANVNVSSNSYNQFNSYSTSQYISNVAGSSVQYSRSFGQYARAGANFRVNQQFGQVNQKTGVRENGKTDVSSDFNFGINQISPFALKGGSGRWYESFRVGLDVSGSISVNNTIRRQIDTTGLGFPVITNITTVSTLQRIEDSIRRANNIRFGLVESDPNLIAFSMQNANRIWNNRVVQARYSIPISLPNVKLLRYINLTPGFSIQGDIYSKRLSYKYDAEKNGVRVDTTKGFFPSYNFSVNASMNTRFYGTFFIRSKRIEAIRHTVAPSISFSYVPDFTNPAFGQFQVLPAVGALAGLPEYRRTLSVFRGLGGSAGSASSTQSAFITFGIVNQLEMKVRTRSDSSGQEFKKIPIFDNLSINGSYNLLAPDYKLSPIALSANTQIFKNISFNFSSTFDPYAYRAYGGTAQYYFPTTTVTPLSYSPSLLAVREYTNQEYIRVPSLYAFQAGQGLLRMTNLQAYVSARFAPKQADKKKSSPNASDATLKAINNNPELYVDFNIPWSMNVSYTFGLTKLTPKQSQVIQALTLTGDLSLTPKWKITVNTGYDFAFKSPTLTTIGINRDLHCWEMAFNWTPYSGNNFRSGNYSFDLRARSSILQELKLSRRRSFYDRGGF